METFILACIGIFVILVLYWIVPPIFNFICLVFSCIFNFICLVLSCIFSRYTLYVIVIGIMLYLLYRTRIKIIKNLKKYISLLRQIFDHNNLIEEDKKILSGIKGEQKLLNLILNNKNFKNSIIYTNKRIYNMKENRKQEIDLIVITEKKIYLVECKFWNGNLTIDNDKWIYTYYKSETKNYETRTYDDNSEELSKWTPIKLIKYKADILLQELLNRGIDVSSNNILYKVLFLDENMKINEHNNKDIVLCDDISKFLNNENTIEDKNTSSPDLQSLIYSFVSFVLDKECANLIFDKYYLVKNNRDKMKEYFNNLPTWDIIEPYPFIDPDYNKKGDIYDIKELLENNYYLNKNVGNIQKITVIRHNKFLSYIYIIIGLHPFKLQIELNNKKTITITTKPSAKITFRPAGSPKNDYIKVVNIRSITIGSNNLKN